MIPEPHASFLRTALARLESDRRIVGVAAGGSLLTGTMDEFSDLDLVVAIEPSAYHDVLAQRASIAASLGSLLSAFTGEHVGEPRLSICLYGPDPLLHVDLKFVSLTDFAARVEDPRVLWERDERLTTALGADVARFPEPDRQWIEDRFWVWAHYGAGKIGRGELFEALDFLSFLRGQVLGPLALSSVGARPSGVRKIERLAPQRAKQLQATVAAHDAASCAHALAAAIEMYRGLRGGDGIELRSDAERAAVAYLAEITGRI